MNLHTFLYKQATHNTQNKSEKKKRKKNNEEIEKEKMNAKKKYSCILL